MNHVKMTSPCLQGLSPSLLSYSLTTCNLEMQCPTPKPIEELPEGTTTLTLMQAYDAYQEEKRYQQTEFFFMVVKDVDSVMTCGAALAQMPKGEKHFANTVPCNTGLYSQSYCSHFQTKTGHFLYCLSQTDCHELDVTTCMGHLRCL